MEQNKIGSFRPIIKTNLLNIRNSFNVVTYHFYFIDYANL